jgi:hypothetical protein
MRRRCRGCAQPIGTSSDLGRTGRGGDRGGRHGTAGGSGNADTESGDGLAGDDTGHVTHVEFTGTDLA